MFFITLEQKQRLRYMIVTCAFRRKKPLGFSRTVQSLDIHDEYESFENK